MQMPPLIARLDARDRALLARWMLDALAPVRQARAWRVLTHLGGARMTIAAVLVPFALGGAAERAAAVAAAIALTVSHLVVQVVKRSVGRPRPRFAEGTALVEIPDRFSFPSGHACAALAVALTYALAFPAYAVSSILLATLIGLSRVRLGVHYPGDVLAGQGIAVLTVAGVRALL